MILLAARGFGRQCCLVCSRSERGKIGAFHFKLFYLLLTSGVCVHCDPLATLIATINQEINLLVLSI